MPAALIPKFAELCAATKGRYEKVALVTDVREKNGIKDIFSALEQLKAMDFGYKILFMEAEPQIIIKRYKESRRPHPLAAKVGGSIDDAIAKESEQLRPIRDIADYIVNTSHLTLGQLHNELYTHFSDSATDRSIVVNVVSFGFKYGMPLDADLVFKFEQTGIFMDKLTDMIEYLLPQYIEEGKYSLTIAVGCTGGRHRSVAIATALAEHLKSMGVPVVSINRDLVKS